MDIECDNHISTAIESMVALAEVRSILDSRPTDRARHSLCMNVAHRKPPMNYFFDDELCPVRALLLTVANINEP